MSMMPMKPEELRQLRAWATEIVVGKYVAEISQDPDRLKMPDMKAIIAEARTLVTFIRSTTGT